MFSAGCVMYSIIEVSDDAICIRLSSICKCNQAALYMARLLLISIY